LGGGCENRSGLATLCCPVSSANILLQRRRELKSRIAPCSLGNAIVTLPGIHARKDGVRGLLSRQRLEQGLGPLSREEEAPNGEIRSI